jgi:hypothetical protein
MHGSLRDVTRPTITGSRRGGGSRRNRWQRRRTERAAPPDRDHVARLTSDEAPPRGGLSQTAPLRADRQRRWRGPFRGVTVRACLLSRMVHRPTPIATPALAGVGDRINTHVQSAATTSAGGSTSPSLVLWIAQTRSRRPHRSISRTANRKRARPPVGQLRLMPKPSGAAKGVGDGRRPAPIQIDHSRRRGPFSGL